MRRYLLFVRNPYARQLATGSKTLELRQGARYASIRSGDTLLINARTPLHVIETFTLSWTDLVNSPKLWRAAAFPNAETAASMLQSCGLSREQPIYAFRVERLNNPTG